MINDGIGAGNKTEREGGANENTAKKNIRNAVTPNPVDAMNFIATEFCTPAFATSTQRLPITAPIAGRTSGSATSFTSASVDRTRPARNCNLVIFLAPELARYKVRRDFFTRITPHRQVNPR